MKANGACLWQPVEPHMVLPSDEVHVWRAVLKQPPSRVRGLLRTLSPDERERAGRFYFAEDRDHFVVARGLLRSILSLYLKLKPDGLRFCYSPYGKPYLATEHMGSNLRFNLSHSHEFGLFAVARHREIGIDLERIRSGLADTQIAERFFAVEEIRILRALPRDAQDKAFFDCWARKEAYVKAKGEGLSMPLDQFEVSLVPGEPAALLSTKINPQEASRWSFRELFPAHGFVAAVAAQGNDWRLKCWEYPWGVK